MVVHEAAKSGDLLKFKLILQNHPDIYKWFMRVLSILSPCIYLSLYKKLDFILVRNGALIQPYLVAYFKSNGLDIDKNKEWLKEYIKNTTILKDNDINESMTQLYCSDDNNLPREGNASLMVKGWPYRPIQKGAENCYMRSHNFRYRIRLGNVVY
ncbi:hypothetical protein RFI_31789 [Reticulomyxa filosa]|uniref:Uncharacterized protein n=1 Tax=Reticulomyxa filosa TaxID=46433 RepID=X6LW53_RETFI|nr:hypothetical protein RFI_31789 [Reticulomyxa filosa]|eukprot:ETO05606.1 hypothetical protein RFI_31789 [Reticulomyxa filosa]